MKLFFKRSNILLSKKSDMLKTICSFSFIKFARCYTKKGDKYNAYFEFKTSLSKDDITNHILNLLKREYNVLIMNHKKQYTILMPLNKWRKIMTFFIVLLQVFEIRQEICDYINKMFHVKHL